MGKPKILEEIDNIKLQLADMEEVSYGTTSQRPTGVGWGFQYYDSTLEKPIWWNGSVWKDANGTIV